jgi:Flp pilus assembly protein TadG
MSISMRPEKTNDDGVVSIELALILPILLLLVFGIIQFGRAYNAKIELSSAVREGARAFALGTDDPATVTKDAAPGLESDLIDVETSASPCAAGSEAKVTATYPFDLNVPFWGNHAITISATGVMRCSG